MVLGLGQQCTRPKNVFDLEYTLEQKKILSKGKRAYNIWQCGGLN